MKYKAPLLRKLKKIINSSCADGSVASGDWLGGVDPACIQGPTVVNPAMSWDSYNDMMADAGNPPICNCGSTDNHGFMNVTGGFTMCTQGPIHGINTACYQGGTN